MERGPHSVQGKTLGLDGQIGAGGEGPGLHDWGRRGQGDPKGQGLGHLRLQGLGGTRWGWNPSFWFIAPLWRGSHLFSGPPPRRWGSSPRAVGGMKWQAVGEGASPPLEGWGAGTQTRLLPLWPWMFFSWKNMSSTTDLSTLPTRDSQPGASLGLTMGKRPSITHLHFHSKRVVATAKFSDPDLGEGRQPPQVQEGPLCCPQTRGGRS